MARKCILCAKEYTYCKSCPKDAKKESWHALYDTENCRNISKALTDYNFKLISRDEARVLLSECDLTIKLNDHYRNKINEIMAKPKRTSKAKAAVIEEIVVEEMPVEEVKEEVQEEPIVVVETE